MINKMLSAGKEAFSGLWQTKLMYLKQKKNEDTKKRTVARLYYHILHHLYLLLKYTPETAYNDDANTLTCDT